MNRQDTDTDDLFDLDYPHKELDENVQIGIAFRNDTDPNKCYLNYTYKNDDMSFFSFKSVIHAERSLSITDVKNVLLPCTFPLITYRLN